MTKQRLVEEREQRKNKILQATLKVYEKVGAENITMDMIASEAGFSKGSLYYYFKSKEDVFASILLYGWKEIMSEVEKIPMDVSNPRKTFLAVLKKITQISLNDRTRFAFLFDIPLRIASFPEELQVWKDYQRRLFALLQSLLDSAASKGYFIQINSRILLRAIGGMFHGIMFLGSDNKEITEKEVENLFMEFVNKEK